jgi:nitrogen-specific signal transduction histidine kinase
VDEREHSLSQEELRELAHEIRNVLLIISGSAQLSLMEEIGNESVKNNLKVIVQETRRVSDMIDTLITASKSKLPECK